MINAILGTSCQQSTCINQYSTCPDGVSPILCLKRYETRPSLKVSIEDCEGAMDLSEGDFVLEVNMWFNTKLKHDIDEDQLEISFADNIGFYQVAENDFILIDHPRTPEYLLVKSFNETEKTIQVERSQKGTVAGSWKKGSSLKVFRVMQEDAEVELVYEDVVKEDGSSINELTDTVFVFNWTVNSTMLSGCFWLEYTLAKVNLEDSSIEWTRKFPSNNEGFLIKINESST